MRLIQFDPSDKALLKRFIKLPYDLYRGHPCWVPPLIRPMRRQLARGEGMQLGGGPFTLFLVETDGRDVARALAGVNHVKNRQHGKNEGYFSLFECIDDREAARTLMNGVLGWLENESVDFLTGPVSPTNGDDHRGILIEGFDEMPAINTPYTPSYYPGLLESLGFEPHLDFYALKLIFDQKELERVERIVAYGQKKSGLTVRPIDLKDVTGEVKAIHQIMVGAMQASWEHLEIPTEDQIRAEFESLKSLIDPNLVMIARIDGEPVGFVAGLPDYNQVLFHLNGRMTPLSALKYLHYRTRITRVRMFMQFVLPRHQGSFVTPTLYFRLYQGFVKKGYTDMEGSTIAQMNLSSLSTIRGVGFKTRRIYRIYHRSIKAGTGL